MKISIRIVDFGAKLKEPADATDADGEKKIPQSAAQPKCPPEAGDEMSALSRLEQNVTFVELNHKAKAPLNAVRFSHSERYAYGRAIIPTLALIQRKK